MMSADVRKMADRVAGLIGDRFGVSGTGLEAKLRRAPRSLPRNIRRAAEYLVLAEHLSHVPKLRKQIDMRRVMQAHDTCMRHLRPVGGSARRKAMLFGFVATLGMVAFVTGAAILTVLRWRGFI